MTDPVDFGSMTPRFELPLLFAAQAQKEFFVNEAHSLVDALLHPVVKGTTPTPPVRVEPVETAAPPRPARSG